MEAHKEDTTHTHVMWKMDTHTHTYAMWKMDTHTHTCGRWTHIHMPCGRWTHICHVEDGHTYTHI